MFPETREFVLLVPSSAVKMVESVPESHTQGQAMTLSPPCFTDELVCSGSWADLFCLHTLAFLSVSIRLIFYTSVHKTLLQNHSFLYKFQFGFPIFTNHSAAISCGIASVLLLSLILLRTVDRGISSTAFWSLMMLLTAVLGFIFTALTICLSSVDSLDERFDACCSVHQRFPAFSFQIVVLALPNVSEIPLIEFPPFSQLQNGIFLPLRQPSGLHVNLPFLNTNTFLTGES